MRCLGLTPERKRCPAAAINETGYCAAHQPPAPAIETNKPTATRRGWLDKLFARPVPHRVPDDVRHAVDGSLKNKSTAQVCDVLLHDPSVDRRWKAAFVLRQRRDPAAIEALWQALRNEPVGLVRQQAAVALGKIGTPAVQGPLIEALWHDGDAAVRQACAIALGNLGEASAARDLEQVLGRDSATFVRWDCALALGQLGDHTVEGLLQELAQNDPSPVVRNACKQVLEQRKK